MDLGLFWWDLVAKLRSIFPLNRHLRSSSIRSFCRSLGEAAVFSTIASVLSFIASVLSFIASVLSESASFLFRARNLISLINSSGSFLIQEKRFYRSLALSFLELIMAKQGDPTGSKCLIFFAFLLYHHLFSRYQVVCFNICVSNPGGHVREYIGIMLWNWTMIRYEKEGGSGNTKY